MTEEMVDIVDDNDNVIGTVPRSVMRKNNLKHRGSVTIVFNSKGEVLVHKRTMAKDVCPGYYDASVGGAASAGESYEECAKKEVEEEIGIKDPHLIPLFKILHKDRKDEYFVYVFKLIHDGPFEFQKDEIEKGFFIPFEDVKEMMAKENFCPGAIEVFDKYSEGYHK